MALETKMWKIENDLPKRIKSSVLDYENRLEDWLCDDIGLLNDSFLFIGRKVPLLDGEMDVLAIDEEANLVVVELKRDKTPRNVVAQILDYASCIQDFGLEEIVSCVPGVLQKDLESAFLEKFGHEIPETVNGRHRMYIVGSSLDSRTQRIVEYLSETHRLDINAATFTYFKTDQGEFVIRSMLLDENEVERRVNANRGQKATEKELRRIASENGVGELWDKAVEGFASFAKKDRSRSTLSFNTSLEEGNRALVSFFPYSSSRDTGLAVTIVFDHLHRGFGIAEREIMNACGPPIGKSFGGSYSTPENCFYLTQEALESLLKLVAESVIKNGS